MLPELGNVGGLCLRSDCGFAIAAPGISNVNDTTLITKGTVNSSPVPSPGTS